MSEEQRQFLRSRIQQLRSRQKRVGPFRKEGIERTIQGMKQQLRDDVWRGK